MTLTAFVAPYLIIALIAFILAMFVRGCTMTLTAIGKTFTKRAVVESSLPPDAVP